MHPDIKENFSEKLRLDVIDALKELDHKIERMLAVNSANGKLRSGSTIKGTMDLIEGGTDRIYACAIKYFDDADIFYSSSLESLIQELTENSIRIYRDAAFEKFKTNVNVAGRPALYEQMLPEVESSMASSKAQFQNKLNSYVLSLKLKKSPFPTKRLFWIVEGVLLVACIFIAWLWYEEPSGNYEPVLAGLTVLLALITLFMRISSKEET